MDAHTDQSMFFTAMASPCVVLVDSEDRELAAELGELVKTEALRIEAKFSRYRPSIVTQINENSGLPLRLDEETSDLIDYAVRCYELSDRHFDITSGALRRVWKFDGSGTRPRDRDVQAVLEHVGWHRVSWIRPTLLLAPGMEVDFGGIGKEYAVDRAVLLAEKYRAAPFMVNLGGDLRVSGPRRDDGPWRVAIEDVDRPGDTVGLLELRHGALATSGDSHRKVIDHGVRYSHVLDPVSGWPVVGAPRAVTVHADTCSEAGLLAKLALLKGSGAEAFLKEEAVRAWCVR